MRIAQARSGTAQNDMKGDFCMASKFNIFQAKNGEYTFNLKAGNGEIVLTASETYPDITACEAGIASVKSIAASHVEDQTKEEALEVPKYELYKDAGEEFRFRLKAANGQIVGKSESYRAKASAMKTILSISRNAPDAAVVVKEVQ